MYNKNELIDAIEVANENIKVAKEQIKRLDKIALLGAEFELNNKFGFDQLTSVTNTFNATIHMQAIVETSKANIKKYKKIIKMIEELDSFENS